MFIARLVSDPVAIIVALILLLVLKISYAPAIDKFFDDFFVRTGFKLCLVKAITLGELLLFNANCQHSKVSIKSEGLKTFKFGIDRNLLIVLSVDGLDHLLRDQLSHV